MEGYGRAGEGCLVRTGGLVAGGGQGFQAGGVRGKPWPLRLCGVAFHPMGYVP